MYAVNMFSSLRKSFSANVKTLNSLFNHIQRKSYKQKDTSYIIKSQIEKDVALFRFENSRFFFMLNLFSAAQCIFWTYLGAFLFQEIKKSNFEVKEGRFGLRILEKERKYGDILSAISIIFGWSVFALTAFYSIRSVKKIILHKGGKNATIVTYSLPGFNSITVPVRNMSSLEHRVKAKNYIPIKLKNKWFFYLVDVKGEFSNPTLFDFTVGVKRDF